MSPLSTHPFLPIPADHKLITHCFRSRLIEFCLLLIALIVCFKPRLPLPALCSLSPTNHGAGRTCCSMSAVGPSTHHRDCANHLSLAISVWVIL
eukprot:6129245-Amphidinium_carterae.1